jgi:predicted acyl esterase
LIDRREFALQFLQLAAALAVPARVFAGPARGEFEVIVQRDVMVAMRDGVKLATDVYLPAKNGKALEQRVPVILERTPYGKSGKTRRHASEEIANIYASHGYAVAFQDCRGRGNSQGEYVKYLSDGRDGYDCCAWIVKQPWSNGRIGTQGLSYGAHTITALACLDAPGLAAMFIDSGGFANAYQGGIRQGGAFELKQVTWAFNAALEAPEIRNDPAKRAALQAIDIKQWFGRMPWSRGHSPLSLVPEYEDYVFDQWEHGVFDDFWKQVGHLRRRLVRALQRCAGHLDVIVVRPVSAHGDRQLHRSQQAQAQSAALDSRALDSRQQSRDLCRRRRLRADSTARRQHRARSVDAAAALVRPLVEGREE